MHVLTLPSWYPANPVDPFGSFFREQTLAMQHAGCKVGVLAPRLISLLNPLSLIQVSRSIQFELDEGMPTYRKASFVGRISHSDLSKPGKGRENKMSSVYKEKEIIFG